MYSLLFTILFPPVGYKIYCNLKATLLYTGIQEWNRLVDGLLGDSYRQLHVSVTPLKSW